MGFSEGVLLGIVAAVCWGTADFCSQKIVRQLGVLQVLFFKVLAGLPLWFVFAAVFWKPLPLDFGPWAMLLSVSLLSVVAFLAFYKGLEIGKLAVVAPISAAYAAVAVALAVLFYGESLPPMQAAAIAAIIAGVALASFRASEFKHSKKIEKGVFYGLATMLLWGVNVFLFKPVTRAFNPFVFGALMQTAMALVTAGLFVLLVKKAGLPPKNCWLSLLAIGALEAFGFLALNLGLVEGLVSIVAPIAATAPAVTIFLAKTVNKEELESNQWLGILVVLVALVMISA